MLVNCTPHDIVLISGEKTYTIPSAWVARVSEKFVDVVESERSDDLVVAIMSRQFGEVTGLPEPKEGTKYIVSVMVKSACPERKDLVQPAGFVRDGNGHILGCSFFAV